MATASLASGLDGAAKVLAGHYTEPRVTQCDVATIGKSTHWMCPTCTRLIRYDHSPFLSECDASHSKTKSADRDAPSMSADALEGFVVFPNFISEEEEAAYIEFLDNAEPETGRTEAWKAVAQDKRRQDYGPQANFKKKRIMVRDGLKGMPAALKKLIRRVEKSLGQEDVGTVHFAPAVIPPRRVLPTKQLNKWSGKAPTSSASTIGWEGEATAPLVPWGKRAREEKAARDARKAAEEGEQEDDQKVAQATKKAEKVIPTGPAFVRGNPIGQETASATPPPFITAHVSAVEYAPGTSFLHPHIDDTWLWGNRVACVTLGSDAVMTFVTSTGLVVDVQLPQRAMYAVSGPSRYLALHGIRPQSITAKRVSITLRELSEGFVHSTDDENLEMIRTFCKTYV